MMALEDNFFIETLLPNAILRTLIENEMAAYRKPYLNTGEDRRPTLSGPPLIADRRLTSRYARHRSGLRIRESAHVIQEYSPDKIGHAISDWLPK